MRTTAANLGRRSIPRGSIMRGSIMRGRRLRRGAAAGAAAAALVLVAACGNFSATAATFGTPPSLTQPIVTPVVPQMPGMSSSSPFSPSPSSRSAASSSPGGTKTAAPADPCVPSDPSVIAACLSAPWGLVPLADGISALVGERTTGRILRVAPQTKPVVIATIPGLDSSHGGGLLGLAISPSYAEDGLIYAYVTTATDNRIVRIAPGDVPKAIFTGIPKGTSDNGGPIAFNGQFLYVATGDAGNPAAAAKPSSLAGKVLRLDQFGKAVGGTLTPGSAVYSSGLTQPTGMCVLPTGALGVLDHRPAADLLFAVQPGKDYTTPKSGDAVWTYPAAAGGAADCAYGDGVLASTSLAAQSLTGVQMSVQGAFSGTPNVLLSKKYGRLLTVAPGTDDLLWMTTSNKDGHGKPVPADDRVIVLPSGGASGGGGPQ